MVEDFATFWGRGLFGTISKPEGAGLPGWVICSPFGKEKINSQRLGFEWASSLAAEGYWVFRFDYRGTGDSFGPVEDPTIHDYLADIKSARAELEKISGLPCRGVCGLRLGASLAAMHVAACGEDLDLVMWEPVVDGAKYRNSLVRTALANEMVHSGGSRMSQSDFRSQLQAGGSISVDGFALSGAMYDSLSHVDLSALGRPTSGRILIVQIKTRPSQAPSQSVTQLVEAWGAKGDTTFEAVEEPPVWMKTRSYRWRLADLFEVTLGWMGKREAQPVQRPTGRSSVEAGVNTNPSSSERPVSFEVAGEKVWGILHEPRGSSVRAENVVLIAAGEACRTAFFYPELARDLAARGWNVLRFDPRGIGDSHGDLHCSMLIEVFKKVENGALVADTVAAMDFLETEFGRRGNILVGLCGGAITAIFAAQSDSRVAGIVPLELPMLLTPHAEADHRRAFSSQIPWDESFSRFRGAFFLLKVRRSYHHLKDIYRRVGLWFSSAARGRTENEPGTVSWYRQTVGEDASCDMLFAFGKTLVDSIPAYCLFADTEQPRIFYASLPGLLAGSPDSARFLTPHVIEGADHNFSMPGYSSKLSNLVIAWLEGARVQGPDHSPDDAESSAPAPGA